MKKLFAACVFAFLTVNAYSLDGERIIGFHTLMNVNADGSARVEEAIKINAEGQNIRRGIYRDIPTAKLGKIEPQSLFMDGEPHPYFTENEGKYLRINFGDNNYIAAGEHIYKLTYNVRYAAQSFKNYDEVYWNITGNDWIFPIEKASFELRLPESAKIITKDVSLYTGIRGSKESFAKILPISGRLIFETTNMLSAGEGFTVSVPFEKGAVNINIPLWMNAYAQTILLAIIFIIMLVYMYWAYNKVGRDPKDVIVTEFKPPEGISPAFARYFINKGYDTKTFAVALISLAMKGAISMTQEKSFLSGGKTIIDKLQTNIPLLYLPQEEENIMTFFGKHTILGVSMPSEEKIMLAKRSREIAKEMKEQNKQYRIGNKSYLIFPLTIFVLLGTLWLWLSNLLTSRPGIDSFFVFTIWIIVIFFQNIKRKKKEIIVSVFIGIGFAAFLYFVSIRGWVEYINLMWFLYFMHIALSVFSSLIDNVTEDGRRLTAYIKGFKRYMQTAEKYRAELSDPTNAEKIFCNYLPYAFAFDIENKWMKTFENILSASVMERSLSYVGGAHAVSSGSFMSGLSSSLSSSSDSGAGGGGSSGGGSGGGGGGGR